MNKEAILQFVSEAIDNGANIHLLFYGNGESKELAEKRIKKFSEIIGSTKINEHVTDQSHWLTTETPFKASMSHFYDYYMQEDVNLSGSVEDEAI